MSTKLFVLNLLILSCLSFIECNKNHPAFTYASRFRSIECKADNYTTSVEYCYIKAVSRSVTTLNIHLKNLRPSYKPLYVHMILYYRYGNIYREVINTKRIEWCSMMEGFSAHLFLVQTIQQIKEFADKAIHKCPYDLDIEVKNLTIDDTKGMDIFPEGTYKLTWISQNKTLHILWSFNVTVQLKSPLKESMG
ncbi:uncharacterized protein [Chironomus tepperi]|uniref:uncharacterized protein n=1 Tax=Chironomus tepperi TaxID=113505 RepID=UPI00391F0B6C